MVEQIDNPANKIMHYGSTNVGVLYPPDKLPKVQVYSYKEGEQIYNQMQYDLYQTQKQAKAPEKHKFPTILKIGFTSIALCSAIIFKKDISKFIKNLFKKHPKI